MSKESTTGNGSAPSLLDGHIAVLSPEDVGRLRLPWDGRFTTRELARIATKQPAISVWNRRSGEYLVGGFWRHRREIATALELSAIAGAIDLIHAFADVCAANGIRMVVASEQAERRKREFYEAAGMVLVEEIIVYELARVRPQAPMLNGLHFERLNPGDDAQFEELLALDHHAFPWLWWNSEREFAEYAQTPGVAIELGRDGDGRLVSYIGITRFRTWGHLDRIAVTPETQGRGFGHATLDYAVMTLAAAGARRVALSTQARNTRSRTLYERYGFRRSPSHDYRLYGRETRMGNMVGETGRTSADG